MKKTWRLVLDCTCAALSIAALVAYATMAFDLDVLPAPLWLSLFAMLPVLPLLAVVLLSLTAKAYIARRHAAGRVAI